LRSRGHQLPQHIVVSGIWTEPQQKCWVFRSVCPNIEQPSSARCDFSQHWKQTCEGLREVNLTCSTFRTTNGDWLTDWPVERQIQWLMNQLLRLWGSWAVNNVDVALLCRIILWTCRQIPTFRRNILLPFSGLYVPILWNLSASSHGVSALKTNIETRLGCPVHFIVNVV
jgi:hypothetical protein